MIEQVARAIAQADGARFEDDPERFQKLALAALKPLARPTEELLLLPNSPVIAPGIRFSVGVAPTDE